MADLAARRRASYVFGVASRGPQRARLVVRAAGVSVGFGAASFPDVQQYGRWRGVGPRNSPTPFPRSPRMPGCIWRPLLAKRWPMANSVHQAAKNIGATMANRRAGSAGTGDAMVGDRPGMRCRAPRFGGGRGRLGGCPMPRGPLIGRVAISLWGPDASVGRGRRRLPSWMGSGFVSRITQEIIETLKFPARYCGISQLTGSCLGADALPGCNGCM